MENKNAQLLNKNWQFKNTIDEKWYDAIVPGCVHLDLLENKLIPNPFVRNNEKKLQFNHACRLIGLFNVTKADWESSKKRKISVSEDYIIKKLKERTKAKNKGDFNLADQIREELFSKGVLIEDQKGKTIWKIK